MLNWWQGWIWSFIFILGIPNMLCIKKMPETVHFLFFQSFIALLRNKFWKTIHWSFEYFWGVCYMHRMLKVRISKDSLYHFQIFYIAYTLIFFWPYNTTVTCRKCYLPTRIIEKFLVLCIWNMVSYTLKFKYQKAISFNYPFQGSKWL